MKQLSYDYLIETVKLMSHGEEIKKQDLITHQKALTAASPLVKNGAVIVNYRLPGIHSRGRGTGYYRLNHPYAQLKVQHVVGDNPPGSRYEKALYHHAKSIPLIMLDKMAVCHHPRSYSSYHADKLLSMLFLLQTEAYTTYKDILSKAWTGECAAKMVSDMTGIGLVENRYGKGYRLCRPLTHIYLYELIPYLCSNSQRKRYYNRLFYGLKNQPVSLLSVQNR